MLRSRNTRSYWSLWKRNLKVIKEVIINTKKRCFFSFPLFCDFSNHMANGFLCGENKVCMFSVTSLEQARSHLWRKLMPLFAFWTIHYATRVHIFILQTPQINKVMSATCRRPKQPAADDSPQYLSNTIFQTLEKAACSITLYLLLWNIFHRLHAEA